MAITTSFFNWYDKAPKTVSRSTWLSDTIKAALITSAYTPASAIHEFYSSDIAGEVATGSGYSIGGVALTNKAVSESIPGKWAFSSDAPYWLATGGSLTARYLILYNDTLPSKPLIGWAHLNFNGGNPVNVSVPDTFSLVINLPVTGWFQLDTIDGS